MDLSPWRDGSRSLFPSAWVASLQSSGVLQDSSCKARDAHKFTVSDFKLFVLPAAS